MKAIDKLPWPTLREIHEQGYARELDKCVILYKSEAGELYAGKEQLRKMTRRVKDLVQENQRLKKALKIYADRENWFNSSYEYGEIGDYTAYLDEFSLCDNPKNPWTTAQEALKNEG